MLLSFVPPRVARTRVHKSAVSIKGLYILAKNVTDGATNKFIARTSLDPLGRI